MFVLIFLIHYVLAEGYYCPYIDLGSTSESQLLYDYYNDNDGTYWTRKGETGWMTVTEYCKNKGDLSLHSDAGEWNVMIVIYYAYGMETIVKLTIKDILIVKNYAKL